MIYFILLLFLIILSFGKFKFIKDELFFVLILFVLWVLATFRSLDIGNDTKSYFELFNKICTTKNYLDLTWRYEIGYLFLNKIISLFTNNFTVFLAVINSYIFYVYYKFITKYSKNYFLSIFLFFTLGIWGNVVNIIRLELAIAVSLHVYLIIDSNSKNKILGLFFSVISVIFHRLGVFSCVSYIIPNKINKRFYKYTFIITLSLFLFFPIILKVVGVLIPYFSEFYLNADSSYTLNDIKLASVVNAIIALIVFAFGYNIFNRYNLINKKDNIAFQINMVWVSFLILLLSMRFNLIDRCSYYFWTFSIVMIPNVLSLVENNRNRWVLELLIVISCISYFVIITLYKPDWNLIYPYKFIFI